MKMINNIYQKIEYGFWKQIDIQPFTYSEEYENKQSTNSNMSFLRTGWLLNYFDQDCLRKFNAVDIGCGNRKFINTCQHLFKKLDGYDVTGESITEQQLLSTNWDLIFMTDVLEHYNNIDDLFNIHWKYAFITFPETPEVDSNDDLSKWKHCKPNEHIYCLNKIGMKKWFKDNNCSIIATSHIEDAIRGKLTDNLPNTTTLLVSNNGLINK